MWHGFFSLNLIQLSKRLIEEKKYIVTNSTGGVPHHSSHLITTPSPVKIQSSLLSPFSVQRHKTQFHASRDASSNTSHRSLNDILFGWFHSSHSYFCCFITLISNRSLELFETWRPIFSPIKLFLRVKARNRHIWPKFLSTHSETPCGPSHLLNLKLRSFHCIKRSLFGLFRTPQPSQSSSSNSSRSIVSNAHYSGYLRLRNLASHLAQTLIDLSYQTLTIRVI